MVELPVFKTSFLRLYLFVKPAKTALKRPISIKSLLLNQSKL
jgi:hypothetical protein